MTLKEKNTDGFSIVIVLVVVLIILFGLLYSKIYKQNNKTATQPITSPFADWQTYNSTLSKFSFKYPRDWAVTGNTQKADLEAVELSAPNRIIAGKTYAFEMMFRVYKPSIPDINQGTIYIVHNIKTENTKPLYSIISGVMADSSSTAGKVDRISASSEHYDIGNLDSKNIDIAKNSITGQEIEFTGHWVMIDNNSLSYFEPQQFANFDDVKIAERIFSSLKER